MPDERRHRERGAVLIITALGLVAIVVLAAVVIDLAAARADRATNQAAADSAATAAVVALGETGSGQDACSLAFDYFAEVSGSTLTGADCSGFPASCTDMTSSVESSATASGVTVTVRHPVDDGDPLMQSSAIGAPGATAASTDGDRCGRVGVEISETRPAFFAGVVGVESLTTSIHAVALYQGDLTRSRVINLLLLERHRCDALTMSGSGGGTGAIAVGPVPDPATGRPAPGRIAVDSDGTVGCAADGTIDVDGANSVIRADGPEGCDLELVLSGSGNGCGVIETFAPGQPGCILPACSSTGTVAPAPVRAAERVTRAPVDWRYNCKLSYPTALDIDGCPDSATNQPYIDQLVADVGGPGIPSGFQSYTAAGHPCIVEGTAITIPAGNWVVECDLIAKEELVFAGGNVVFDGDLVLESSARVSVNGSNTGTYTWTPGTPVDHTRASADAAYLYFRSGSIKKSGQSTLQLHGAMVYFSPTSTITMTGGVGGLEWYAPTEGPFEDLALWSESLLTHRFTGQSALEIEGVIFAPHAILRYSGTGAQQQLAAQLITRMLHVTGSGVLYLSPSPTRALILAPDVTALIR